MIEVNEHASTFWNVLEKNNYLKVFHKLLLGDHTKTGFFFFPHLQLEVQPAGNSPIQNADKQMKRFKKKKQNDKKPLAAEEKLSKHSRGEAK